MEYKKEIISKINELSGSRSPYDVFYDWVKCMALAFQNSCTICRDTVWKKREEDYLRTINSYGKEADKIVDMMALLAMALEEEMGDILGEIYMESGCGNKNTGQFFTPFNISCMCSKTLLEQEDGKQKIELNEPSCGGGGMIIAAAKTLKGHGINYQKCMDVVAQDLDWKAVYMCYVQLSLLGISAVVVQGNTLTDPDWRKRPLDCVFRTPAKMGVLLYP